MALCREIITAQVNRLLRARVVGAGPFPHLDERLLENILRFLLIAQDRVNHREKTGRKAIVEGCKGRLIASSHLLNQLRIGFIGKTRARNGAASPETPGP